VGDKVAEAAADLNPWNQLVAGCATFLKASTEPQVQQIMLIDAPAVLGWGGWRELDAATSMQYLEDVLTRLVDDRTIARQPVKPLVHLLSGAMNEAALWLAQSESRDRDLAATTAALSAHCSTHSVRRARSQRLVVTSSSVL